MHSFSFEFEAKLKGEIVELFNKLDKDGNGLLRQAFSNLVLTCTG